MQDEIAAIIYAFLKEKDYDSYVPDSLVEELAERIYDAVKLEKK